MLWILMAPAVAGSAAARDVETRMHPLIYTAPISKAEYLGGRFLAAFVLNGLILLAVPLGILAALFLPGMEPEIVGPLRPAVYLSSYGVLALPTAFTVTAVQFSLAALNRRAIVSYLGGVFLLVTVSIGAGTAINFLQMPALGTYFTNLDLLPAIGYQRNRELRGAGVRKQHGLAQRPTAPSLYDIEARRVRVGGDRQTFEAMVGTSEDQTAIAPGALRRTWTQGGRRYFHYVADGPINNQYALFSGNYALHEELWSPATSSGHAVAIQIFHHSKHAGPVSRMVASVRASLDRYTREFGPYPHSYLRLIENPARGMGVQSASATVQYGEGFSLVNSSGGSRDVDVVFAVVAHSVAHEWWGEQVAPADVQGAGLLTVGLEMYSAMRVVEDTLGPEHLRRYLSSMRYEYASSRLRAAPPLLRATDSFAYSRRGPFALYTIREYVGKDRVDDAVRQLFEKHRSGASPPPTSLDLYRELQTVTPDQFQSLLHDLFEKNTLWEFSAQRATAAQAEAGTWLVTLNVRARKVVVSETGLETEVPMNDLVQVGVFSAAEGGEESGKLLYIQMHRIRSGNQTITVTVPRKPSRAGLDPNNLFIDRYSDDDNSETSVLLTCVGSA